MSETVLPPKITDASVTLTFSFIWDGVTYSTGAYFGYCTIADVSFEFSNIDAYTSLSNTNQAMEIAYAAIEIQEALQPYYTMPYSGSNMMILTKLRELNAKLAFARLIDRYFTANNPNHSEASTMAREWCNHQITQIAHGEIRWDAPFGDAVGTARLPVFSRSAASNASPNPYSGDSSADPIFTITDPGTRQGRNTHSM